MHDYLTVDGQKLSKSLGTAVDPVGVVDALRPDALRWWFLRDVPRAGDADFRAAIWSPPARTSSPTASAT